MSDRIIFTTFTDPMMGLTYAIARINNSQILFQRTDNKGLIQ